MSESAQSYSVKQPPRAGDADYGPVKLAFLALAVSLLLAETINFYHQHWQGWYNFDDYQFLEAARQLARSGLSRLPYLPNSSVGLDILYWSHHFPPISLCHSRQDF